MQLASFAKNSLTGFEIVGLTDSMRLEGAAELRHDNFLRKVPDVLGLYVLKFKDICLTAQSRT